jgi:hypothetical protein
MSSSRVFICVCGLSPMVPQALSWLLYEAFLSEAKVIRRSRKAGGGTGGQPVAPVLFHYGWPAAEGSKLSTCRRLEVMHGRPT